MDHMQASVLQLMETVSRPQPKPAAGPEDRSDFRKLLREKTAPREPNRQDPAEAPRTEETPAAASKPDDALLQQLAAMQLFCADATVHMVVPEEMQAAVSAALPVDGRPGAAVLFQPGGEHPAGMKTVPETALPQGESPQATQTPAVTELQHPAEQQLHQENGDRKAGEPLPRTEAVREQTEVLQSEAGPEPVFSRVETAPVKVSQLAKPQTESRNVAQQVTEQVTQALGRGETRVQIQLTPEHLGKITVELTEKSDGALHIALHADSSRTRALLERELPLMQSVLSRDTQQTVEVHVPRQQDAQQNAFDQQGRQQQPQQQQQEPRRHRPEADFLHQLRLGLVPAEEEVS